MKRVEKLEIDDSKVVSDIFEYFKYFNFNINFLYIFNFRDHFIDLLVAAYNNLILNGQFLFILLLFFFKIIKYFSINHEGYVFHITIIFIRESTDFELKNINHSVKSQ